MGSKTITWADPAIAANRMRGMTGLQVVRGLWDGTIAPSPMMAMMNATVVDADEGTVRLLCVPGPEHENPFAAIHGGYLCAVLGTATASAVLTTLGRGVGYTVETFTAEQERVVTVESAPLSIEATVVAGDRGRAATAVAFDAAGARIGSATSTFLVLDGGSGA
jgi:acyl-coenzyme A thioesterase PaaI-like protein